MVESEFIEQIHIISSRIPFLDLRSPKLKFRDLSLDVGVSQKDSLSIDLSLTKLELQNMEKSKERRIYEETKYIRENKINLILTDSARFQLQSLWKQVYPPSFSEILLGILSTRIMQSMIPIF